MINVYHVYYKVASKAPKDTYSKPNTHRVVEFNKRITSLLVKEMINVRDVLPTRKFFIRLDER